jgi:hypothetical protein
MPMEQLEQLLQAKRFLRAQLASELRKASPSDDTVQLLSRHIEHLQSMMDEPRAEAA